MLQLDETERRIFLRIAEVLFAPMPGGDALAALGPRDLRMHERIDGLLAGFSSDADRLAIKVTLRLFGSRAGGLALFGRPRVFTDLGSLEAERVFLDMLVSSRPLARQSARLVRTLVGVLIGHALPGDRAARRSSPVWDAIGYPGPLGEPPTTARRLSPIAIEKPTTWTADVVVVGSGAGGGVAAGVLAKAGLDVVVLERGPYRSERDFSHYQDDADRELYDVRATTDLGVSVLSGRCVGGGTVVNYSTSLRAPASVREEWDREAGFRHVFSGPDLSESFDAVSERLGVTSRQSKPWARDRLLAEASTSLGWSLEVLPRNVRGCAEDERCGFCNFGCRLGAKQSTMRTWLEDATGSGARLVAGCEVERVIVEGGRAVAVRGERTNERGERIPLTVFAKAIVIACGAPYTPVLLARSGIRSPALGENLHLHPVTGVWGLFPDELTDPWGGVMQARLGTQLADLDGLGYGVRIESGAVHPAELAVLHGWGGAYDYKEALRRYRHWVPFALLLRDRSAGRVSTPRWGPTTYSYELGAIDQRHVREGVRHAAMALREAGATEIRSVTSRPVVWRPGGAESLEAFMGRVDGVGYGANQHTYGSYHPSGTARMGSDPKRSVCDETNQVHGVPGLYVMDASCFPTASGVNPMLTIEAIAHRGARSLAGTFNRYG